MNKPNSYVLTLLLSYTLFLFYGVLYPFHDWCLPKAPVLSIVLFGWFDHIFAFDIVQNLILFLPFGLFAGCYLIFQRQTKLSRILLLVTLASFFISFFLESMQTFNPCRIPSLLDVALNTVSGLMGAVMAILLIPYYSKIIEFIHNALVIDTQDHFWPILGISVWIGWGAYQLFPFIPTLHPKQVLETIMPIIQFLKGDLSFCPLRYCSYTLQAMMLYFSGKLFIAPSKFTPILVGFMSLMFLGKIAAISRLLSIEMVLGMGLTITALCLGHKLLNGLTANEEINEAIRY